MLALANARLMAHQGGWDEIIVLVAPVLLFAVIRILEKRRRPTADEAEPTVPGVNGTARPRREPAPRAPETKPGR